jgi:hypothetical protein
MAKKADGFELKFTTHRGSWMVERIVAGRPPNTSDPPYEDASGIMLPADLAKSLLA